MHWQIQGVLSAHAPKGPNCFIFAHVFAKKHPYQRSVPPNGSVPPTGNPGSATGMYSVCLSSASQIGTFDGSWTVLFDKRSKGMNLTLNSDQIVIL